MSMLLRIIVSLFFLMNTAFSLRKSAWERVSVLSCAIKLRQVPWDFESKPGFYTQLCSYEPAFGSWSSCIHEQLQEVADESAFVKSLECVNQLCSLAGLDHSVTLESYYTSLNNASDYIQHMPSDYNSKIWYPVSMEPVTRRRFNDAYYSFLVNFDNSNLYGLWLLCYFIIIMGIASLLMIPGVKLWLFRFNTVNKIRGNFFLPTLAQTHASYLPYKWMTGLVPTKLESLLVLGFFLLHGFLVCYNYKIDPYNCISKSYQAQWLRQIADRTGVLSFAHLPLIIIFSARNNILEHLTGFKYTTFIVLHKWIGRSMVIDAVVHGIAYSQLAQLTGTSRIFKPQLFWKIGVVAAYVSVIICILSMGLLRRHCYETFLYLHIALAAVFFYTSWVHIKTIGWQNWIYASVALWILERLLRLKSILKFGIVRAKLELIGPDLFRVSIPHPPNWPTTKPAQYLFLYFLQPATVSWQSHPFTFVDHDQHILIVVKAKTGATRLVLNHLIRCGGTAQLNVLLEGPYGASSPLPRFQDTLLLCAGSGIPGPLSYALKMARPLATAPQRQNLHLLIVNRGTDIIQAFADPLIRLNQLNLDLQINITRPQTNAQYGSTFSTTQNLKRLISSAQFHQDRPNVNEIINNILQHSRSLAICCCGPPAFVDLTRNHVARMIQSNDMNNTNCLIEYFEEYQTW